MTTQEVADKLVKLCSEGKFHEAMELVTHTILLASANCSSFYPREASAANASGFVLVGLSETRRQPDERRYFSNLISASPAYLW